MPKRNISDILYIESVDKQTFIYTRNTVACTDKKYLLIFFQ